VYVALAADRWRVAQARGDLLDRRGERRVRRCRILVRKQRTDGENGARPRTEILGRELAAHHVADVLVNVVGIDVLDFRVLVDILEEALAGQLLYGAQHACEALICQPD